MALTLGASTYILSSSHLHSLDSGKDSDGSETGRHPFVALITRPRRERIASYLG